MVPPDFGGDDEILPTEGVSAPSLHPVTRIPCDVCTAVRIRVVCVLSAVGRLFSRRPRAPHVGLCIVLGGFGVPQRTGFVCASATEGFHTSCWRCTPSPYGIALVTQHLSPIVLTHAFEPCLPHRPLTRFLFVGSSFSLPQITAFCGITPLTFSGSSFDAPAADAATPAEGSEEAAVGEEATPEEKAVSTATA